jgi:hypothetical protein
MWTVAHFDKVNSDVVNGASILDLQLPCHAPDTFTRSTISQNSSLTPLNDPLDSDCGARIRGYWLSEQHPKGFPLEPGSRELIQHQSMLQASATITRVQHSDAPDEMLPGTEGSPVGP